MQLHDGVHHRNLIFYSQENMDVYTRKKPNTVKLY